MPTSEQHKATIDGTTVAYTVKRSPKARYARLEIGADSGLIVVIPAGYSIDRVRLLIRKKRRWILEKLFKYGHVSPDNLDRLKGGDTVRYLGKTMKVEARESDGASEQVSVDEQSLVVSTKPGKIRLTLTLEKWYRDEAKKKIGNLVDENCSRMGVKHNRVTLKGHRSIWGSCSHKGNLNFNWRLLMAPEPVIEYVVVHELAHLMEMGHSQRFWQIVSQYCPRWREHRDWLKTHASELNHTLRP